MLVEMHSRVLPGSPTRRPFAATSTTSRDCATVAHAHWRTVDMLRSERRTVSRHVASWHHYAWETPLCGGCAVGAFVTSALRSPCSHDAWNFHCVPCDCVRCGALEGVVLAVWRDSEREAEGVHVATGESHRALSAPLVPAAPLPCRTVFARRIIGGVIYVVPSADAACCRELSRRSRLRAVAISVLATPEVSVVALPAVASARCLLPVYEDNRASPHAQEAVGKSEGSCWLVWLRDADVISRGDG